MAKKRQTQRRKAQARRTGTALADVATAPVKRIEELPRLSEEAQALAFEIAANRQAILKLGGLVLDHERRLGEVERVLEDLAGEVGEDGDVIELEPEPEPKRRGRAGKAQAQAQAEAAGEGEGEAEAEAEGEAARWLGLPALFDGSSKARAKGRKRKAKGGV